MSVSEKGPLPRGPLLLTRGRTGVVAVVSGMKIDEKTFLFEPESEEEYQELRAFTKALIEEGLFGFGSLPPFIKQWEKIVLERLAPMDKTWPVRSFLPGKAAWSLLVDREKIWQK